MPLIARACLLSLGLVASTPPATSPGENPPPDLQPVQEPARLAYVAAQGLELPLLEDEIAMRVPELRILPLDQPAPTDPFIYIQARHESGRLYRLALIDSEGRAYYERVDVGEAGSPERVLASSIAALVVSIDSGAVEPDATEVEAPLNFAEPPDPIPAPEPEPEPEPAPEPRARLQLGLRVGLDPLTALASPAFADRHLGWYGGAALELRSARGLFAAFELRAGGTQAGDHRLTRIPISAQLGYAWRLDHLELVLAGALGLSPWLVTTAGQAAPITKIDDGRAGRPPVLALGLRLSPGYLVDIERGSLAALRIGPRLQLDGGFVLSSPPRVAGLESETAEPLFRLGGLELDLGLELTLWFEPQRP